MNGKRVIDTYTYKQAKANASAALSLALRSFADGSMEMALVYTRIAASNLEVMRDES